MKVTVGVGKGGTTGVGIEVGKAAGVATDVAPDAAGSGVVTGAPVGVAAVAVAPGVAGADPPHAIASVIKMLTAPERIQPCFIISPSVAGNLPVL